MTSNRPIIKTFSKIYLPDVLWGLTELSKYIIILQAILINSCEKLRVSYTPPVTRINQLIKFYIKRNDPPPQFTCDFEDGLGPVLCWDSSTIKHFGALRARRLVAFSSVELKTFFWVEEKNRKYFSLCFQYSLQRWATFFFLGGGFKDYSVRSVHSSYLSIRKFFSKMAADDDM